MPGSPVSALIPDLPLVGRGRELATLRAALVEARAGRGGAVLLAGEPGIGKTRLLEELAAGARAAGMRVAWGRCWEGTGAPPFWPWLQILRALAGAHDADALRHTPGSAADIAALLQDVRAPPADPPSPPSLPDEGARFRQYEGVSNILLAAARAGGTTRGLVILLDDLHWADAASLGLLRFLVAALADAPLLLAGSYRDTEEDRDGPLRQTLASLGRERGVAVLPVRGLDPASVAELVGAAVPAIEPAALAPALHARTAGNPFFIREVVRHLPEGTAGDGALADGMASVPPGVRDALIQRVSQLDAATRDVLAAAAVAGQEFGPLVVQRAVAGDTAATLDALGQAARAGLVTRIPSRHDAYRFVHALVREALYDDLAPAHRAALHRRIGDAIEAFAGPAARPIDQLAHHFVEAAPFGEAAKAIRYSRLAAERATAVHAYEAAARHYETALRLMPLLPAPDGASRIELLLALGATYQRAVDIPRLQAVYLEAAELARKTGDDAALVRAALGLAEKVEYAPDTGQTALRLLREALAVVDETETEGAARVLAYASLYVYLAGDRDAARRYQERAARIAGALGDPELRARALSAHPAIYAPGSPEERLATLEEMWRLLRDRPIPRDLRSMRIWHISTLTQLGRFAEVGQLAERSGREGRETGQATLIACDAVAQASRALMDGRLDESAERIEHLGALVRRVPGLSGFRALRAVMDLFLRREQGTGLDDGTLIARVRGLAARPDQTSPMFRCLLAALLCDAGRIDEAAAEYEALALDDFAAMADDRFDGAPLLGAALLGETCAALGDTHAAALYERLLAYDNQIAVWGAFALMPFARPLGLLATALGHWDDAERHIAAALTLSERSGARAWAAWAHHDRARMLLARDASGDREKAIALLDGAGTSAATLDMTLLERTIERARASVEATLPDAVPARARRRDGLTRREAEIVGLIAAGLSNREIAVELVLSVRTVERHIENVYAKLGVHGHSARAAVAGYAARRTLQPRA